MRVLLVEDDELLGDGIQAGLALNGFQVDWLRDGLQAQAAVAQADFDLLVLDLGLPHIDGLSVLRGMRERQIGLPCLILTARDAVGDRVAGLDAGADDYLVKPFALEGVARLTGLLNQLLRLAQLEHGGLPRTDDIDPLRCCTQLCEELAAQVGPRGPRLKVEGRAARLAATHEASLRMALSNLLHNAIAHSPADGEICLRLHEDAGLLRLCVLDQGPGLPPEAGELVVQRFYRAPGASGSGSGLGLAIVERIACLLGGRLLLSTPADGRGLCACLELPRAADGQSGASASRRA